MGVTYNSSNVGSSGLATVRFLTGDTSTDSALLQDGEINGILGNVTSNHTLAAAYCAEAIAGKYSRQADTSNEGLSVSASQRSEQYRRLASQLRQRAYSGAQMFVGGRSLETKAERREDSDLVQPLFEKGMDDFAGSAGALESTT